MKYEIYSSAYINQQNTFVPSASSVRDTQLSVGTPKEIPRYGCTQPAWNDAGGGYVSSESDDEVIQRFLGCGNYINRRSR